MRMTALHILLVAVLSIVMGRAAHHVVNAVRAVGSRFGVSKFLVGFVFLGMATSTPEISVALLSAFRGTPGLSLGNLLGANIVILSLLSGLAAIIGGKLHPGDMYRKRTLPLFLLIVLLPAFVVMDGRLTRADGVLLVVAHFLFILHLYWGRESGTPRVDKGPSGSFRRQMALAVAALAVLVGSSYFLVNSALIIARDFGATPLLIGLVFFSIGTNLPEFTLVLTQSGGWHKNVVLGDLFGSLILNTPTLGLLAIISPFTIADQASVFASAIFLIALGMIFGWFLWTGRALERREGYCLIALYAAYLVWHAGNL
jgi:cation:H+ antiporter